MEAAARFEDWNPTHFLDVAEMSLAVSLGYDLLYSYLSEAERATIKSALMRHCLSMAAQIYDPSLAASKRTANTFGWVTRDHNWNSVCNCGMLAAALVVADEEADLCRLVVKGK